MRGLLSAILFVHAIAHVPGFLVPWRLMTSADMPYRTTVLNGLLDIGPLGIRAVGIIWLALATAFGIIGIGLLARTSWWFPALVPLMAMSVLLCLTQLPDARLGLLANGVIVALLLIGIGFSGLAVP
jgi:hypothetical protein